MAATNFEKTVKGEKFWSFSSVFLIKSQTKVGIFTSISLVEC